MSGHAPSAADCIAGPIDDTIGSSHCIALPPSVSWLTCMLAASEVADTPGSATRDLIFEPEAVSLSCSAIANTVLASLVWWYLAKHAGCSSPPSSLTGAALKYLPSRCTVPGERPARRAPDECCTTLASPLAPAAASRGAMHSLVSMK
eukprot:162279-Prymnesium_polylepis.2